MEPFGTWCNYSLVLSTASVVGVTSGITIYWWLVDLHDGQHGRIVACYAVVVLITLRDVVLFNKDDVCGTLCGALVSSLGCGSLFIIVVRCWNALACLIFYSAGGTFTFICSRRLLVAMMVLLVSEMVRILQCVGYNFSD